jgi:pyrroloquinoline quinone (PQQ) biosynthesis protein C
MTFRNQVEDLYRRSVGEFLNSPQFRALETGAASRSGYDAFLAGVVRSHLRSPQLLAFLFSLAPPDASGDLLHNMLEELGIDHASGIAHASMLREMAAGAGLAHLLPELEAHAIADIRQVVVEPVLYGTLREVGLAALVEVEAFEYMLSRSATRIARALKRHRRLSDETLKWFTYHSEVDIEHAEQGLQSLEKYIRYYDLAPQDALTIAEMSLRENVFLKRYFGALEMAAGEGRAFA